MKKICFVTTVSITIRAFVIPTIRYLSEHTDWEITVVCDRDDTLAAELPNGVRYIPIPMKRGISIGGIKAMLAMRRLFKKEQFDLVQYSTPNASLYASMAAKLAGVPVRLYCQWGMAYVGFSGIKRKIFKTIEKIVCRLSTWVEPDSFGNLAFAHEQGLYPEGKGSVIWNGSASGVSLEKFDITKKAEWRTAIRAQYEIDANATVFGFVGRITRDKGINELFAAFRRLLETGAEAYLLLVGSVEETEGDDAELHAWARSCPQVIFCGYTTVAEQFLAAMDVYVLPSYREGFGSAVIEAEAMGVPVVVTKIPGPTDAMADGVTGLTVTKQDVDSLYEAMQTLWQDAERRVAFGEAGVRFATEKFDQTKLMYHIMQDRKQRMGMETE